jgi:prepilin-type N-terminal cleavage/methylation domain-containing protein
MPRMNDRSRAGFTLLEMMLVIVVMSAIMMMLIKGVQRRALDAKINKTALQMQQILSAGLAYYNNNGSWPAETDMSILDLDDGDPLYGYITPNSTDASNPFVNPWGNPYYIQSDQSFSTTNEDTAEKLFAVSSEVGATNASIVAAQIAGILPMGGVSGSNDYSYVMPASTGLEDGVKYSFAMAAVNIPGLSMNNARGLNFANIYGNGACVPQPSCPVNMEAQIFTAAAGFAGLLDESSTSEVYPIEAMYTWAVDGSKSSASCSDTSCSSDQWQVCMAVYSEESSSAVSDENDYNARILAMTRCAPSDEDVGDSGFWP